MELVNPYINPGLVFQQYNNRSELTLVATICGHYKIVDGQNLTPVDPMPPVSFTDVYDHHNHLIHQADFVPFKPATDVTALARSYSPSGKPEKSWLAGIRVGDVEKILKVHGPREWKPDGKDGWSMGEAAPVDMIPVSYLDAFGGLVPRAEDADGPQDCHRFNPLGPGLLNIEHCDIGKSYPAPRIEAPDDPITDWRKDYQPQGFAPIAPVWRFRQQYAGTYDETWLETRHPFLPFDFDYRFYQCAHPDLVIDPYLQGGETVELVNLHPVHKHMHFTLPQVQVCAQAHYEDGTSQTSDLILDGVHFDLFSDPPTVRMTWRTAFMWHGGIKSVEIADMVQMNGTADDKANEPPVMEAMP